MGTPAAIGIENADGTIRYVVVNYDGMPSEAGITLYESYAIAEQVNALIDLGELSSLDYTLEKSEAYHRDMGEDYHAPENAESREDYVGVANWVSYRYLFTSDGWYVHIHAYGWLLMTGDRASWERY